MFSTIFSFEFKRWFRNLSFYIYFAVLFLFSFFIMAGAVGYFDSFTVTTSSNTIANSPLAINGMIAGMSQLVYFIVPTIIGATVYRDFKYNMHTVLFSYPFNKLSYLLSKFLSGLTITIIITFSVGLGFLFATVLPFANQDILGPINLWSYFQAYIIFVVPNIIFAGVIIFALVTLTRNVYIGFIFVIVLFLIQALISNLTNNMENLYAAALIEPFGGDALNYVTKYWTIEEQNTLDLPFADVIVYNRLIWLGVSALIFVGLYFAFSFSHSPITLGKKKKAERVVKNNFGSIVKIDLPKVKYDYSFLQNLKTSWNLSDFEFKSITKNWVFISVMAILMLFIIISGFTLGQELFGTLTYPVTWKVIQAIGGNIDFFSKILIYLFAGVLLQQSATSRMNLLVDSTPIPNWSLLLSKFLALVKMTLLIMVIGIISCVLVQIYHGFYDFDFAQYIKEFFGFRLIISIILIFFALFIQSLFKNYLAGFFTILVILIAWNSLGFIGIEQPYFFFNSGSDYSYSDMNGFGNINNFIAYKIYWMLFGFVLFGLTLLFWRRGILSGIKERMRNVSARFKAPIAIPVIASLLGFLFLGYSFYRENTKKEVYYSSQEREVQSADFEKKYKKFEHYPQPRIVDVNVAMEIFPKERNYKATVKYIMVNKTNKPIDSLFINYGKNLKEIKFEASNKLVSNDTVMDFDIYKLDKPLQPKDTLKVSFIVQNEENSFLKDRSPVIENGTFLNNGIFPSFGYPESVELFDNDVRKKYNLKPKERMPLPTDSIARQNTYISNEADWITFETIVSTSDDQTAIAPGYLQKQWKKDGRNYFHYKMERPMLNFYAFNSGRYEVKRDKWNDVNLEIYYHKNHTYNLDRMMDAMKKSLAYYSENFSPYQHKQARIIEFPNMMGTFAQSFANTIPFSEAIGFIAKVDEENPDAVDYPFSVVSHEIAHQWWAHQVIGANVQGATLLSESLSEYSSLKVLEHQYGKPQMRRFLKDALDNYLQGRTFEWKEEKPLMYNENQQYIHYNKGSLVLYALSDYIGEKNMNNALKKYVQKVAFQEAPYTNSIELVNELRAATPDSLKYIINDMFETITLYDNKVTKATSKKLPNGKYEVTIEFDVSKYKANKDGKRIFADRNGKTLKATKKGKKYATESYPLNDYIEIGVFTEETIKGKKRDKELHLKKVKITGIENKVKVIVNEKPLEAGVDPYNKLIDTQSDDNRMKM